MRQRLSDFYLGHVKLFITELLWIWNSIFYTISCKITFQINLNYYFFTTWKQIKLNSLLTVWYALRPNQQHIVSPKDSQSIKINIEPSNEGTIIRSTHRPTILDWRLLDLYTFWYSFFVYQFKSRIGLLVYSSFAND